MKKKRTTAILAVCLTGLAAYLVWLIHDPQSHGAEYYYKRGRENYGGHDHTPPNPKGAIADFNRAIKLNPEFAAAYAGRAEFKAIMADPGWRVSISSSPERERELPRKKALLNEAIADLDLAIELDPSQSVYFEMRARLKHGKGDFSGVVADMARASEVITSAQLALMNRMRQEGSLHITPEALLRSRLKQYDRAIAHNPDFSWGYYHRGVLKHLADDLDAALADFRRCSEFFDSRLNDYAAIHIWLVRAQKSETEEASVELFAHLSPRTNNMSSRWEMQIAGFLLDQVSEADILAAASGSEVERKRSQFCYYKGMKLLLAGDQGKAAECFREALTTEARPYAVLISVEIQPGALKR